MWIWLTSDTTVAKISTGEETNRHLMPWCLLASAGGEPEPRWPALLIASIRNLLYPANHMSCMQRDYCMRKNVIGSHKLQEDVSRASVCAVLPGVIPTYHLTYLLYLL